MKNSSVWILFVCATLAWLMATLLLPPSLNGNDVMIFRDAGWNLVATGHFESSGLLYMRDLAPHFYAHYTPAMPLLFAGYLSIFPRNAYAGTIFNFLLGVLATGCALTLVTRSKELGRRRTCAAIAIALFPIAFIEYDRPETLCYVACCLTFSYAAKSNAHPVVVGCMVAGIFLVEPFGVLTIAPWVVAAFFLHNKNRTHRCIHTAVEAGIIVVSSVLAIVPIALLYYWMDPTSLHRFALHAFGQHSGTGLASHLNLSFCGKVANTPLFVALSLPWHQILTWGFHWITPSLILLAFMGWVLFQWRQFTVPDWILLTAGILNVATLVVLFPLQQAYPTLLAFFIPSALLIAGKWSRTIGLAGLSFLAAAVLSINLLNDGVGLLFAAKQGDSYRAASMQPAYLRSHLSSPDEVVAFNGGVYDLYKPEFHHLVNLFYAIHYQDGMPLAKVGAVINCYYGFDGGPGSIVPFPNILDASQFRLIQRSPDHLWITIFGHRISNAQRGYGCDLYVKKGEAKDAPQS